MPSPEQELLAIRQEQSSDWIGVDWNCNDNPEPYMAFWQVMDGCYKLGLPDEDRPYAYLGYGMTKEAAIQSLLIQTNLQFGHVSGLRKSRILCHIDDLTR